MPPHQISLKEMWLHFVCLRAKFRAVGQRWTDYYNWMKVNWKQLCSWSDADLLYVLLESVLNIFGRNVWWYYEGRPSGKPAVGFFHSTPNAILIRRFGRKDRLGQEFPFRCEMEASLARIETNKQTHKKALVLASLFRAMLWNRTFCGDWLSDTTVPSHRWILSPCNVASASRELHCKFHFISVNGTVMGLPRV